jgi:transcriptional regulator with XRE-family HTH domain
MGNIEFGELVRALRVHRMIDGPDGPCPWSRETLAAKTGLTVRQIQRTEKGEVVNLRPYLDPLAEAFGLTEAQKIEFYADAGYVYRVEATPDREQIRALFQGVQYPASARTPLWDFIAFNSYHYALWGYTTEKMQRLDGGDFGPNLLRVLFDPVFEHKLYIGGEARWEADVQRSVQAFRFQSICYVDTNRYHQITEELQKYHPAFYFYHQWHPPQDESLDNQERGDWEPVNPIAKVHHPKFGKMEFLSLRTPKKYLGSQVDISIYVPLASSEESYQLLRESIDVNEVYEFREISLD